MALRVLVCGGRDFDDYDLLSSTLDKLDIDLIIEGGAAGADNWAWKYAKRNGLQFETYRAEWDKHGKSAGHVRNQQMLDEGKPDMVVAFPTKASKGTWDMVKRSKKAGLPVTVVGS